MKQKLLLAAAALLILALSVGGTMAYYTGSVRTENVITTGNIQIALREYAKDTYGAEVPFPAEGISGVVPGQQVYKRVFGENTGANACYMRARIQKEIQSAEGNPLSHDVMTLNIDASEWVSGGDGWYYCLTPVQPGTATADLFTAVAFDGSIGNAYQKATARVTVFLQGVQWRNNSASVLDAVGWPKQ